MLIAQRRAGQWGGGVELLHMSKRTLVALILNRLGAVDPGFNFTLSLVLLWRSPSVFHGPNT